MYREDNELDLQIKSMLDGVTENVPSHIWDDLQRDLDAAQKRRLAMAAWLRRGVICTAAAAAIVAAVIFVGTGKQEISSDAIAVIDDPVYIEETDITSNNDIISIVETPVESGRVAVRKAPVKSESKSQEVDFLVASITKNCCRVSDDMPDTDIDNSITGTSSAKQSVTEDEMWESYIGKENYFDDETKVISDSKKKKQKQASVQLVLGAGTAYSFGNNNGSSFDLPASAMVGVKANFAKILALETGIKYSYLTRSFNGDSDNLKITSQQHYIGIPVNLYISIIKRKKVNFYVWAGGTAEKCLVNKYSAEVSAPESKKGFLYSAGGGLGVELALTKRLGLYVDPEVRYYFAGNNLPVSARTQKPLQVGGELGLRIKL